MVACQISRFPQTDRNETERFSVGGHKTRQQRLQPPPQFRPAGRIARRPMTRACGLQIPDDVTQPGRSHAGKHYALARARTAFHVRPGKTGCGHFGNTLRGKPAALRPDAPRQTFSP